VGIYDLNLRVLVPICRCLAGAPCAPWRSSVLATLLSFPLGLVGALMRIADNRLARAIATGYVETVRNIPLLVVLYILFLVLPLYGIRINSLTPGAGLAINNTAYTIEIVRAGFAAIPPGLLRQGRWFWPLEHPNPHATFRALSPRGGPNSGPAGTEPRRSVQTSAKP